ncbi:protein kinase family protein [Streptomyces corynorhini]|uniref:hypothetical protein n=1 Tax=Streptomyces corynorhini TaxID=2282652 RepID=UPI001F1A0B69|nr:hypothetical protein [Streptomyces corynorhini]
MTPGGPQRATLAFTTPSGGHRSAPARLGRASRRDPLLPQQARNALLDDEGQQCVQVRLSAADAANPAARALLDTEAGTALRLHRILDSTEYAALFPRVIGHDLDSAEPFLLYEAPRGTAAARRHVMGAADQRVLARDLLLALCLLAGQGLVPRGISPASVRWDGTSLQLWGLDGIARTGRPRTPWGRAPYCSPEQRRGEGLVDSRDAVWSAAQVLYQLATGRPGAADRAPADLGQHRMLAETLRGAFAPLAVDRPTPDRLLDLLAPGAARRVALTVAADETGPHREAFAQALRLKAQSQEPPGRETYDLTAAPVTAEDDGGHVLCPYCLETIQLDLSALFVPDSKMQYQPLDLAAIGNPLRRQDLMRGAVQKCAADPDFPEHFIPVPYLMYGRPLTVAMIGQSSTGKSHLLTQMIAEITDGGLEPFGLTWQSVNPEQHARFVRERVQPLRSGRVLDHTGGLRLDGFARFVESLLITDAHGRVRPVAFFDLGGEDLVRTDAALRFLLGVDAMVFVVDPALALPLPELDRARERWGLEVNRDGDLAFGTVLDRLPRNGPYLDVAAAVVLAKADLLRFRPPVDRWLSEPPPPAGALDTAWLREESQDVYGLLRHHAGPAWLRPFDAIRHCTLHVASATGGQEDRGRFPAGARPRRVLEPLVSLLAMRGVIEVRDGARSLSLDPGADPGPAIEAMPTTEAGGFRGSVGGKAR